ncbi:Amidohydrolase family protein, partial [Dethiosulfatibacter aminovorans DSM 17477]
SEILDHMERGDVVTHCFNKLSHKLFDDSGVPLKEVVEAKERGVLFDAGHGTSSFSFEVARKAIKSGFKPDLIGTDIYSWNYNGPVYNLATTMSKLIAAGMSLEECIDRVTFIPSKVFDLNDFGTIEVGKPANLSILRLENKNSTFVDSMNIEFTADKIIKMDYTVCNGVLYSVRRYADSIGNKNQIM